MKTAPRRQRSDSAAAALTAHKNAAMGPIKPPKHVALRAGDRPFWNAIVTSRARDTWTDSDLTMAGNLARSQADIERLQIQLDEQGYVIDGKANPLAQLVETLSKRAVSLSRVLQIHALATVGRSADAAKALSNERQAREQEGDDLIPRLRAV
jgi:hypothetical protein